MAKVDDQYILQNYGRLSQREMADRFGVSVSTINRHAKGLGLKDGMDVAPPPISNTQRNLSDDENDHLKRLYKVRDVLWEEIQVASGASVAKLSKEYRETLTEISRLEGGGDGIAQEDIFTVLAKELTGGVPRANV